MTDHIQRQGKYHYLRYKTAPRAKIEGVPASAEYKANYDRLLAEAKAIVARADAKHAQRPVLGKKKPVTDEVTIDDAVRDFFLNNPMVKAAAPATVEGWRRNFRALCRFEGTLGRIGNAPIAELSRDHIRKMFGRVVPPASNKNFLAAMRTLMKHCIEEMELFGADDDPTLGLKAPKPPKVKQVRLDDDPDADDDGFRTWPEEFVVRFRATFPAGTRARNAMELMRYSGAACVDVIRLGWNNFKTGQLVYRRQKTGQVAVNPFWPELQAYLAEAFPDKRPGPFILDDNGMPYGSRKRGNVVFSKWFIYQCRKAGLPEGYGAHGVRKYYATDLAVNREATVKQLMGCGGWGTATMAIHYTKKADLKQTADVLLNKAGTRQTA
jgi:integrase